MSINALEDHLVVYIIIYIYFLVEYQNPLISHEHLDFVRDPKSPYYESFVFVISKDKDVIY